MVFLVFTIAVLCVWSGIGMTVFYCAAEGNELEFIGKTDLVPIRCVKVIGFLVACGPCVWLIVMSAFINFIYTEVILPTFKKLKKNYNNKET